MDLFLANMQLLALKYINWWTGVVWITCGLLWCFYQLFGLSFWRHPFTAEHPLVSKWCNATFLQIWWRNKLIYILDDLRVSTFSAKKNWGVNFSFNNYVKWHTLLLFCTWNVSFAGETPRKQVPLLFVLASIGGDLGIKHQTRGLFSEQFIKH